MNKPINNVNKFHTIIMCCVMCGQRLGVEIMNINNFDLKALEFTNMIRVVTDRYRIQAIK